MFYPYRYIMRRPLLLPIVAFLTGIFISDSVISIITAGHIEAIILALIFIILLLVLTFKRKKLFYFLFCLFLFLLGTFRYAVSVLPAGNDISKFINEIPEEVLVCGTVRGVPERKSNRYSRCFSFPFRAEYLLIKGKAHSVSGLVRINLFSSRKAPEVGDRLAVGGRISLPPTGRNPGGFDYRRYLNRAGIRAVMSSSERDHYLRIGVEKSLLFSVRRGLSAVRSSAGRIIRRHFEQPAMGIIESVILGMRGGIEPRVRDIFIKTGTMHILAVSGLHTGIVAAVLMGSLWLIRCPRHLSYFLTIAGICAFAIFTGSRPSSVRAALMLAFLLSGMSLGRKSDIINSLALSAFLITFFQPGQLFRPGFILSYLAVLSIIYVRPLTDVFFGIIPRTSGEKKIVAIKRYLLKKLSVSSAVWVGMMPALALNFHIITPSAIPANFLAVSVLFVTVVLGMGLLLAGSLRFLTPLAKLTAGVLHAVILIFVKAMRIISHLPFSFIRVSSPNIILIAVFYTALIVVITLFRWKKKGRGLMIIFFIFAANLFLWGEVVHKPPASARITFFDVGRADASLMEFPDGSVMMIDGGAGGGSVLAPYLWERGIRRIDCVLLTHIHEDHLGGLLCILENFDVGVVIDGAGMASSCAEFQDGFSDSAVRLRQANKAARLYHPGRIGLSSLLRVNSVSEARDPYSDKGPVLYKTFRRIIRDKNIRYLTVKRGDVIRGFPDMDFIVLNPPAEGPYGDSNNDSIVVKAVSVRGNSILFCADAGAEAIKDILRFGSLLRADLVKVPHHGTGLNDIAILKEFFERITPADIVITNRNSRCLSEKLMKIFREAATAVYVTGDSGAVIAEETDKGFRVRTYKGVRPKF